MSTNSTTPSDTPADDAFDRVRDADPAADAHPDLARVRSAVDVSGAAGVAGVAASGVDELAVARARRRRPAAWLQVAAVVAGLAVVGGGGFALGRHDDGAAVTAVAPISLTAAGGNGSSLVGRPAAPQPASDQAARGGVESKMAASWYSGRTVFTGSGLSTTSGTATAWTFNPSAVFSQETAARVAAALGVTGAPSQPWGAWSVGPQDGTGPSVQLQPDGLASVSYYDPTRDPWTCVKSAPDRIGGASTGAAGPAGDAGVAGSTGAAGAAGTTEVAPPLVEVPAPSPGLVDPGYGCQQQGAPAPTGDAAIGLARDTMTALGVDPAGFELEVVADPGQATVTSVTAYQVVDAQRTGVTWSFTLVASGVQSLNGSLAPLVELGTYAIISPADAVGRLGDARFGTSFGGVMPMAGDVPAGVRASSAEGSVPAPAPTVPSALTAGAAIPWAVESVTLTTARLGLGMTTLTDGTTVLVPSYELGSADGSTWSVIAVADDRLDFTSGR